MQKKDEYLLGYAIGKTNWYMKTLINKLLREEGCNITTEQWLVLKVIAANPSVSQTEIAEKSQKDKTNITRIIDLLEKSDYIERQRDENDRRMYRIHLTKKGEEVLQSVNPITQRTEEISTQALSKKKVIELIDTLNGVCDSIKKVI